MAKSDLTFEEVLKFIEGLPFAEFKKAVNHYAAVTGEDLIGELERITTLNLQTRLKSGKYRM